MGRNCVAHMGAPYKSRGNQGSCSWGRPPQVGTGSPLVALHRFYQGMLIEPFWSARTNYISSPLLLRPKP
ncbi:hypothetical protein [Moorena sp. SIO4G3]|uniref:hypothetical protein n=1 Tax=Moorena sp. SIO4G3 TaxID=2607821 RepID=UPI001429179C|nr:hypothetical protein [Moorena sp. SIO4G3]NEO76658.1 hypothetical protein [Moorena sp. SIO4G3]